MRERVKSLMNNSNNIALKKHQTEKEAVGIIGTGKIAAPWPTSSCFDFNISR